MLFALILFEPSAYYTISKPIGTNANWLLADNIEEAKEKAQKVFELRSVAVNPVSNTDDPQIYDI